VVFENKDVVFENKDVVFENKDVVFENKDVVFENKDMLLAIHMVYSVIFFLLRHSHCARVVSHKQIRLRTR
jgi:hypothetical protein